MAAPGLGSRSRSVGRRPFADTRVGVTSRTGCKACSRGAQTKTGSSQTMKTYLIDREEAVPYLARENPAQEHAALAGHQKSRTPAAAPGQEQALRTFSLVNRHIHLEIRCSSRFAGSHFHSHRLVSGNIGPAAAALLLPSDSFDLSRKGDLR
jgi:hypothetical protein